MSKEPIKASGGFGLLRKRRRLLGWRVSDVWISVPFFGVLGCRFLRDKALGRLRRALYLLLLVMVL